MHSSVKIIKNAPVRNTVGFEERFGFVGDVFKKKNKRSQYQS